MECKRKHLAAFFASQPQNEQKVIIITIILLSLMITILIFILFRMLTLCLNLKGAYFIKSTLILANSLNNKSLILGERYEREERSSHHILIILLLKRFKLPQEE